MPDNPAFYVHEKADSDLEDIFDYSVAQFGFVRAERYIYNIEQVFKDLAANPKRGRRFDPDINHYFHYPVESHCIFYAPTGRGIEIFRILHKSMLPTLHL
ncbi:MAG: type II toxin-antitoxin system RelE/ParE family toxin [Halieaceae bacterium]|jgi:toxin ParE1/3/4|nr:type II toxin-antitoxin system RelE/ParE family toxin [Halieaceae bacterium]